MTDPTDDKARRALVKARSQLIRSAPFYGSMALRMPFVRDDNIQTMEVDGEAIYYLPVFVNSLNEPELQGVLAHEVTHIAVHHHTRRGTRDPEDWNKACDWAINGQLVKAGFTLPAGALINAAFDGKSAETIYGLIHTKTPDQGKKPGSKPGQGTGGDPGSKPGQSSDPGKTGGVRDAKDKRAAERKARNQALQSTQVAKMMGDTSADIDALARALKSPQLPWHSLLRDFMENQAKNDFTWAAPNRRYMPMGVYLPSLRNMEMGEIVICVDTSGSVTQDELDTYASETAPILADLKPSKVTVIYCDAAIKKVDEIEGDYSDFAMTFSGRGGTSFKPPFEYVAKNDVTPAVLVYFTDMHGPFPEQAPDYPVIWVSTSHIDTAPFGEVVKVQPGIV